MPRKHFTDRLIYGLFRLLVGLIAITPFWLLYRLADGLSGLLFHLIRYRRRTVMANLQLAFPADSPAHRRHLAREAYRNLADILLETVKGFTLSREDIRRRYRILQPEMIDEACHEGRSVITLTAHTANWEWGALSLPVFVQAPVYVVYKPIKNYWIDRYIKKQRARFGARLTKMTQTGRTIVRNRTTPSAFIFAADQSPSDTRNAHWVPFFGRETAFIHGFSKLAAQTGYALCYLEIARVRRGYYTARLERMPDPASFADPADLTAWFARRAEQTLQTNPADWLWTHRRWKRQRGVEGVVDYR